MQPQIEYLIEISTDNLKRAMQFMDDERKAVAEGFLRAHARAGEWNEKQMEYVGSMIEAVVAARKGAM